jgi:apolipoprotein N-acyltransferase
MLSEYTFDGPVPQRVRDWCREHKRYLVVGGKEPLGATNFYNTAFVVGPDGEICHRQVKSVPIQFFMDGLPAPKREAWRSPWGPMGILICYDLSYTRVADDFVRQDARALLVPTMDVTDWGRHEHELHARVASLRAAEYRIPIFRVCSSGISQLITAQGTTIASAPYPGQAAMLGGSLPLTANARVPRDRILAATSSAAVVAISLALILASFRSRSLKVSDQSSSRSPLPSVIQG